MKTFVTGLLKGRIIGWSIMAAVLTLWVAGAPANAKDMVPYMDSLQMSVTTSTDNPDGTTDQVIEGTGNATHLGKISVLLVIQIQPAEFDLVLWAYSSEFAGTAVETAANGEILYFSIVGREFLPLDQDWHPIYPYRVEAIRKVTGGTGRFQNATGTMAFTGIDEDGISGVSTGELSSVGANKK
jgi:hypothetical protein